MKAIAWDVIGTETTKTMVTVNKRTTIKITKKRIVIDTVFVDEDVPADEVVRSLIHHDGYDPDIKVRRSTRG